MHPEISNFVTAWSSIFMSAYYCYGITKIIPKGKTRLIMFLPVLFLFLTLPHNLKSVNFVCIIAFFITFIASFKLLLLVFGHGPLSDPSLSLLHFLFITCIPVIMKKPTTPKSYPTKQEKPHNSKDHSKKSVINDQRKGHHTPKVSTYKITKKVVLLIFLICLGPYKDKIPRDVFSFLVCMYIYTGLEVMLGLSAIVGQAVLQTELEPGFNDPYLSTSLQDFWSRRWNRAASSTLHSTVYKPILSHFSQTVGQKWAGFLALIGTFLVSSVMHEVVFYYLGRVKLGWGTMLFFLLHGICLIVESILKKKIDARWQLPQVIIGPIIFGFVMGTFVWLPLPELMEYDVVTRALEEYAALGAFVKDWVLNMGKNY